MPLPLFEVLEQTSEVHVDLQLSSTVLYQVSTDQIDVPN